MHAECNRLVNRKKLDAEDRGDRKDVFDVDGSHGSRRPFLAERAERTDSIDLRVNDTAHPYRRKNCTKRSLRLRR